MRLLKIFVVLSFTLSLGFAQKQPFAFPKYAMQFAVKDLLRFDDYMGSVISFKYHLNNHYALRAGIDVRYSDQDQNRDEYNAYPDEPDSLYRQEDFNEKNTDYGLTIVLLRYFRIEQPIKVYIGNGAGFSLFNKKNTNKVVQSNAFNTKYEADGYRLNWRFLCGVEWFFHSAMSLNFDYGFNVYYEKKTVKQLDDTSIRRRTRHSTRKSVNVSPLQMRLGLSVYF